jgi:glutamyl aminopeptidase
MKATYTVSLIRPSDDGYSALSNMPMENEEPYGDGLIRVNFKKSVSMSTYLTVFIVSDFENINKTITPAFGDELVIRCFGTPAQVSNGKLDFALKTSVDVIEFYVNYFKIPYPLPKLDLAAIPDFVSGAMETW